MAYILVDHNLKSRNYHQKLGTRADQQLKYVWVDKANGRFHIESSSEDILTCDEPLLMWWLVNENDRQRLPFKRQCQEASANMPEKYDAVVRIKLEKFKPSHGDRLLQKVSLQRNIIKDTTFGVIDKPSIVGAVMPCNQQPSTLEATEWVQYLATPVGNTLYLLHPSAIRPKAIA